MADACDSCECGLSNDDLDTETEVFEPEMDFEKEIRDTVIDELGLDDEMTFISQVTVCPRETRVEYHTEP
jgi:hypothetical protein